MWDFNYQAIITFGFTKGYDICGVRQRVMNMDSHGIVSPGAQKTEYLHLHYVRLKLPEYYKQKGEAHPCSFKS